MIHPSYKELIEVINNGQDMDEAPAGYQQVFHCTCHQ